MGKLKAIVTQNIDCLHQKAGSKTVYEIHGSIGTNYCTHCFEKFDAQYIFSSKEIIPRCNKCGGIIKPEVVLYEEPLDYALMECARDSIHKSDLLIIAGTSLNVYPATGLVDRYNKKMVIINLDETKLDDRATLVIHEPVEKVFGALLSELGDE